MENYKERKFQNKFNNSKLYKIKFKINKDQKNNNLKKI